MAASTAKNIFNAIVDLLTKAQESGSLKYVGEIFQGVRQRTDIADSATPAIILEPLSEREENHSTPYYKRVFLTISITCWMKVLGVNTQIVGETKAGADTKGIMDFVADVKNVINSSNNLEGTAIMLKFPTTSYFFEAYPYRSAEIQIEVEFICQYNAR